MPLLPTSFRVQPLNLNVWKINLIQSSSGTISHFVAYLDPSIHSSTSCMNMHVLGYLLKFRCVSVFHPSTCFLLFGNCLISLHICTLLFTLFTCVLLLVGDYLLFRCTSVFHPFPFTHLLPSFLPSFRDCLLFHCVSVCYYSPISFFQLDIVYHFIASLHFTELLADFVVVFAFDSRYNLIRVLRLATPVSHIQIIYSNIIRTILPCAPYFDK